MSEDTRGLFCQAAAILGDQDGLSRGSLSSALQILLPVFWREEEVPTLEPQILEFLALVRPLVEFKDGLLMAIDELDDHGMQLVASLILAVDLKRKQPHDQAPAKE